MLHLYFLESGSLPFKKLHQLHKHSFNFPNIFIIKTNSFSLQKPSIFILFYYLICHSTNLLQMYYLFLIHPQYHCRNLLHNFPNILHEFLYFLSFVFLYKNFRNHQISSLISKTHFLLFILKYSIPIFYQNLKILFFIYYLNYH